MPFSTEEYADRHRRMQRELAGASLDALLVSGDDNIIYFSGARSLLPRLIQTRPLFFLLPTDGEPVLLIHASRLTDTRINSPVSDLRAYTTPHDAPYGSAPVALLADLLRERRLPASRIGVELGHDTRMGMPVADFESLKRALPEARFQDAAVAIWNVRMRKSPGELALLRRSAEITGAARQRTFAALKPGMTDREVLRLFFRHMLEEGGDRPSFGFAAAGPVSEERPIFGLPTGRRLEKGDLICLDGGCWVEDYSCDYDRLAVLGKPTARQLDLYRTLYELHRSMLELFRPGVRTSEIYLRFARECARRRLPNAGKIAGHGMGLLLGEPPRIAEWDDTLLEPGTVCSSEPHFLPPDGAYVWEDVLVITEQGHELLTPERPELVIVD